MVSFCCERAHGDGCCTRNPDQELLWNSSEVSHRRPNPAVFKDEPCLEIRKVCSLGFFIVPSATAPATPYSATQSTLLLPLTPLCPADTPGLRRDLRRLHPLSLPYVQGCSLPSRPSHLCSCLVPLTLQGFFFKCLMSACSAAAQMVQPTGQRQCLSCSQGPR